MTNLIEFRRPGRLNVIVVIRNCFARFVYLISPIEPPLAQPWGFAGNIPVVGEPQVQYVGSNFHIPAFLF